MSLWLVLGNHRSVVAFNGDVNSKEPVEIIDEHKLFLMGGVLLFSTYGICDRLEGPDIIEKIQRYMLTLLQRYLIYRYGYQEAMNHLARAMDIMAMAREAHEIRSRRLPV